MLYVGIGKGVEDFGEYECVFNRAGYLELCTHQEAGVMELLQKHIDGRDILPVIWELIDVQLFNRLIDLGLMEQLVYNI